MMTHDTYVVKPFAFPEPLARIQTLFHRGRFDVLARLEVADLKIDTDILAAPYFRRLAFSAG
jgi:DNA-binding response OmpR family regulator